MWFRTFPRRNRREMGGKKTSSLPKEKERERARALFAVFSKARSSKVIHLLPHSNRVYCYFRIHGMSLVMPIYLQYKPYVFCHLLNPTQFDRGLKRCRVASIVVLFTTKLQI
jgi:hypothetical protein